MERLFKDKCNLRKDSEYCDLKIRCQGIMFYVHRLVVCSQSSILAAELGATAKETTEKPIDYTKFNAETLERMLLFMYNEDYALGRPCRASNKAKGNCDDFQLEAPSARTHVEVYNIAAHYALPDLKKQAIANFKSCSKTMTMEEFFKLLKHFASTDPEEENELTQELLFPLMNTHTDWFDEERFWTALEHEPNLQHVAVRVATAVREKMIEREIILKTEIETYRTAKVQLDIDLEHLNDSMHQMRSRNADLESANTSLRRDLRRGEAAKSCLEDELASTNDWSKKLFEEAQTNQTAVKERDQLLEESRKSIKKLESLLQQKELALRQQTDRANNEKKEAEKEKNRANTAVDQYKALVRKNQSAEGKLAEANKALGDERNGADHAFQNFNSVQSLINDTKECTGCGYLFLAGLYKKGKKTKLPIIRCKDCGQEHSKQ